MRELPQTRFGELSLLNINPKDAFGMLQLSGDGAFVFFMNEWGPNSNPPVGQTEPPPSGRTIYRTATDGSGTDPVFQTSDLADVAGLTFDTENIFAALRRLHLRPDIVVSIARSLNGAINIGAASMGNARKSLPRRMSDVRDRSIDDLQPSCRRCKDTRRLG